MPAMILKTTFYSVKIFINYTIKIKLNQNINILIVNGLIKIQIY